jgi:hypothetical protein
MTVNPQMFTTYVNESQKAEYKLVIPIINQNNSCRLEIRDANDSIIKFIQNGENEFLLERNDSIGDYRFSISLYDTSDKNSKTLYSQQNVIVNVLGSSSELNLKLVEDAIKTIKAEYSGGGWTTNPNYTESADLLHNQLAGVEIPIICNILRKSKENLTNMWRGLLLLSSCSNNPEGNNYASNIIETCSFVIGCGFGGPVTSTAWNIVSRLNKKPQEKWNFLTHLINVITTNPQGDHSAFIQELVKVTPTSKREESSTLILEILEVTEVITNNFTIMSACKALETLSCRSSLPKLYEIFTYHGHKPEYSPIIRLFKIWNYLESIPILLEILEITTDTTICSQICDAFKSFNCRETVTKIKEIILTSDKNKVYYLEGLLNNLGI